VIVVYVALVFATDLFDGLLARRLGEVTRMGRYLDATTDYMVLTAMVLVFRLYGLIPVWFFVLVLCRFAIMAFGNLAVYLLKGGLEPHSSPAGKASVFAMMVFFAFKLLDLAIPDSSSGIFMILLEGLELLAAAIVVLAVVQQAHTMIKRIAVAAGNRA
jgi:CDP-diacylglycerol--glycerol-3-phosphate 3-phosphatidyltransferase